MVRFGDLGNYFPLSVLKIHLGIRAYNSLFVLKIHLGINSGPDNIQYLGFN